MYPLTSSTWNQKEHGSVTLPSRQVGAVQSCRFQVQTARIAVIVQTGGGFLSVVGDEGRPWMIREDCYGRATVALTRAIQHTYIVSPLDMAGMIEVSSWLSW